MGRHACPRYLAVGVIVIALFVWRQLTMENPFLELRVFKSPVFTIAAILSGVTNMAMVGAEMVLPLYIQNIRGESAFHSGLTLLAGSLMMGIIMPITGRIFDKYGAKRFGHDRDVLINGCYCTIYLFNC